MPEINNVVVQPPTLQTDTPLLKPNKELRKQEKTLFCALLVEIRRGVWEFGKIGAAVEIV